jgi:hypothetical protein
MEQGDKVGGAWLHEEVIQLKSLPQSTFMVDKPLLLLRQVFLVSFAPDPMFYAQRKDKVPGVLELTFQHKGTNTQPEYSSCEPARASQRKGKCDGASLCMEGKRQLRVGIQGWPGLSEKGTLI